jgi:hypothetical protein
VNTKHTTAITIAALAWIVQPMLAQSAARDSTASRKSSGFVVARYVESGTRSIYSAQRVGPVMALGGVLHNTRARTTTTLLGIGMARSSSSARLSGFVAAARSSGDLSLRMYMLPAATLGIFSTSAIVTLYQPLGDRGVTQAAISPLILSLRVTGRVKVGAAAAVDAAEGRVARVAAGPYVQVRIPGGIASVEWMQWQRHTAPSVRWGFSATY